MKARKPMTFAEGGHIGGTKRWAKVSQKERTAHAQMARRAQEARKRRRLKAVCVLLETLAEEGQLIAKHGRKVLKEKDRIEGRPDWYSAMSPRLQSAIEAVCQEFGWELPKA